MNPHLPSKARILLVDDHPILRHGMTTMINAEEDLLVCGEADGVQTATKAIEDCKPDLALVDLAIRDGDGLELIKVVRAKFPRLLTLVLSMYDEEVYAERALRAGARGYIMKAEAAKSVVNAIRAVLRGDVYVSEQMAAKLATRKDGETGRAAGGVDRLTDRELQILRCIGRGMSVREIADELYISGKTVEAHREHIKQKLNLVSSGELLRYAIEHTRVQS